MKEIKIKYELVVETTCKNPQHKATIDNTIELWLLIIQSLIDDYLSFTGLHVADLSYKSFEVINEY